MPNSPFVIGGKTIDADGNIITDVDVTVSNDTNNETLTTTSDSTTGEWEVNLADMTSQWVAEDIVSSKGEKDGYETFQRTYPIVTGDTVVNVNQNLFMFKTVSNEYDGIKLDPLQSLSRAGRTFLKGAETYTLTATATEQTADGEYQEIPQNNVLYITHLYIGSNGSTDDIIVQINKNNHSVASIASAVAVQVGKQFAVAPTASREIVLSPIRIPYASDAKSVTLSLSGGTTDSATVTMAGYILNENQI